MIVSTRKVTVTKIVVTKAVRTVIATKSLFYANMMKAQGNRVYGPYHNDMIYIHRMKEVNG
jgi:hypothetical protein